jgi:hypothetical protein
MVASKVEIIHQMPKMNAAHWICDGSPNFIKPADKTTLQNEIILHTEIQLEFLKKENNWLLNNTTNAYPIKLELKQKHFLSQKMLLIMLMKRLKT